MSVALVTNGTALPADVPAYCTDYSALYTMCADLCGTYDVNLAYGDICPAVLLTGTPFAGPYDTLGAACAGVPACDNQPQPFDRPISSVPPTRVERAIA